MNIAKDATAPVEASGQDDPDLKLIIAHTIIEDLRVQHPGIEQIDNERGDIWLPGGSTPQSSGCIIDIHSVAQSVEQQVLAALRPGHTDLMVSPENIDAFLEANPPPVEASGSEREHGPKCWGKTSLSDEMAHCYCGSTDSPSGETREAVARIIDPAGWATWDHQSGEIDRMGLVGVERSGAIASARSYVSPSLNKTDAILALLSARPRALGRVAQSEEPSAHNGLVAGSNPAATTSPLALGGQHSFATGLSAQDLDQVLACSHPDDPPLGGQQGEVAGCAESEVGRAIYERIEKLIDAKPGTPEGDELSFLAFLVESVEEVGGYDGPPASISAPTTPARAEAQNEGAAGERDAFEKWYCDDAATVGIKILPIEILALREGDTYGAHRITLNSKWEAWQARAAHPSPTPAADADADADRVRIAVEALEPFKLAADNMDGDEPDGLFIYDSPESTMISYGDLRRAASVHDALKSTAAKESKT